MKDKTPDELHKGLGGQVIRLDPHPTNDAVICMRCEPIVVTLLRSMPTAPQTWYSPTDTAYLVKAADTERLTAGLRAFGAAVVGAAAPAQGLPVLPALASPRAGRPAWCGKCDERTRLVSAEHGAAGRCPECHPLRAEPLARREPEEAPSVEEYQAGVRRVRDELHRLRLGRSREIRHGESVLVGELVEPDDDGLDDEAHPF